MAAGDFDGTDFFDSIDTAGCAYFAELHRDDVDAMGIAWRSRISGQLGIKAADPKALVASVVAIVSTWRRSKAEGIGRFRAHEQRTEYARLSKNLDEIRAELLGLSAPWMNPGTLPSHPSGINLATAFEVIANHLEWGAKLGADRRETENKDDSCLIQSLAIVWENAGNKRPSTTDSGRNRFARFVLDAVGGDPVSMSAGDRALAHLAELDSDYW